MKAKIDHPGVYPPPPLFYVLIFILSTYTEKFLPLSQTFFASSLATVLGVVCVAAGLIVTFPALIKFFKTKNTLITIKPANSLQTTGIYSISRNPMYLGLLTIYIGIAFFIGNWWTLIFIPLVVVVITYLVIVREEKYLERAFGEEFVLYRKKVRRWI